jgi:hypothetical protein
MTPHLLLREVGIAVLGCTGISMVQLFTPLQDGVKRIFQGVVCFMTLWAMAHVGGLV